MTLPHTHDSWLKKIQTILTTSSLDKHFPFPWEEVEKKLSELLGISDLSLSCELSSWHPHPSYSILSFELSPILGAVHWAMSPEDVSLLSQFCLSQEEDREGFSDPRLQEGYYKFLILRVLHLLDQLKIFKETSLRCVVAEEPFNTECKCLHISISLPTKTIHGKLLLPETFLDHFRNYKPFQTLSFLNNTSLQKREFPLHFEIGKTSISSEEWQNAQIGDFLVLDQAHYDPSTHKGSLVISLKKTAILQGRIKSDGIKILDLLPLSEEEPEKKDENLQEIRVELEPISMPLKNILELKPESLIEISPHPEQAVLITIHSKIVGKGELIKLGHVTGVRILKIDEREINE